MSSLRACLPPVHLETVLDALPVAKKGPPLLELYTTAWTDLPSRVLERSPPHLTQPDLVQVLEAKLTFGQNRPALRGMIAALDDRAVVAASTEAFQLLGSGEMLSDPVVLDALRALTTLRGVGPATASLVLSLFSPSVPFFSDEAAVVALRPLAGRKGLKYNEKEYRAFLERVREMAGEGRQREWERRTWLEETAKTLNLELDGARPSVGVPTAKPAAGQGKRKLDARPAPAEAATKTADDAPSQTGRRTRSRMAADAEDA
jgi:hypothetical protein